MDKGPKRGRDCCTRRDLIIRGAGAALAVHGFTGCRGATRGRTGAGGPLSHVAPLPENAPLAVARSSGDPAAAVRAVIHGLGGMDEFVSRGDTVTVKPNIGWDRPEAMAANTHPEVVAALVTLCLDAGAARVKVFDHPCNDARRTYRSSGIAQAATDAGADVFFLEDRSLVRVEIPDAVNLKEADFYREAFESDVIINAPVAKHHGLTRLTLGYKNLMGFLGPGRNRLHQNMRHDLVDLSLAVRPELTVIDAWRVIVANGPQGGSPADVEHPRVVAASRDMTAADSFAATLFGLTGPDIGHVQEAADRGFGVIDLDQVELIEV